MSVTESSVIPATVELQSGFQERERNFIYCNFNYYLCNNIYVFNLDEKMSGKHTLLNFFM